MAIHNIAISSVITSPTAGDFYRAYSTIGGITNYYGGYWKYDSGDYFEQTSVPPVVKMADFTAALTAIASPAKGDTINITGTTIHKTSSGEVEYQTGGSANHWRCKRPA